MARKPNSVPTYRHHQASGQAFIEIQGQRRYLGKWNSEESRERYARVVAELAAHSPAAAVSASIPNGSPIVVVQLLARYWEFAQGHYRKNGSPTGWLAHIRLTLRLVREHYLLRAPDAFCFSPAESDAKRKANMRAARKTKVQPSQIDRKKRCPKRQPKDHYSKDSFGRAVRRAVDLINRKREAAAKKANIEFKEEHKLPRWHPNQLRHSLATKVRKSFGLEGAQVVLGHAKADVTQVYAERDGRLAAAIMKTIG